MFTTRIDGVLVDTTTDTKFATGSAGFREAGPESSYFANVVVTGPGGAIIFDEDFGGGRRPAPAHGEGRRGWRTRRTWTRCRT